MAAVKIDPLKLTGPWAEGHVLERQHTISSEYLGHDSNGHPQFESKRSELGELVFRLKNRSDRTTLDPIADTAAEFLVTSGIEFDALVPVPPSRPRPFQPVVEIATAIGSRLAKPVLMDVVSKVKETPELKNVFDFNERQKLLEGAFGVNHKSAQSQRLLLIDDLYRSGATATIVAKALIEAGASAVYFLAMTKTRTRS